MTLNKKLDDKIQSSEIKKTEFPQIELKNPYRVDVFVTNLLLLPNAYFSKKGIVKVQIGNITVLDESPAGTYERNKSIQISLNEEILKRDESIKIWFWNGIDANKVTLSALAKISDNPNDTSQAGETWSADEINNIISDNSIQNTIQFLSDVLSGKLDVLDDSVSNIDVTVDQTDVIDKLQGVIDSVDLENIELKAKLDSIISATQSEHSSAFQVKIADLIDSLPDSPDNVGILEELQGIKTQVGQEHSADTISKIQELITALPDSPDNV